MAINVAELDWVYALNEEERASANCVDGAGHLPDRDEPRMCEKCNRTIPARPTTNGS